MDDKDLITRVDRQQPSGQRERPTTAELEQELTHELPRRGVDAADPVSAEDEERSAETVSYRPGGDSRALRAVGAPLDLKGHRLASYEVIDKVGAGGMGDVYVAKDHRLGRRVALKVLPPDMAEESDWLLRFKREAKALAALNHPNIVTIHSVEEVDGVHFLTMELVDGHTLREEICEEGMEIERFLDVAAELTAGLARAHANGIVHRDLKPRNVMLTADDRVKILDFGLAKVEHRDTAGQYVVTGHGEVLGTVAYMSPEQVQGETVDARSDVFSLGIMLYEMSTGQRPFQSKSEFEHLAAVISWEPKKVTEIREKLPVRLAEIISKCLEKEPADRYANAVELHDEIVLLAREVRDESIISSRLDILGPEIRRSRTRMLTAAAALVVALTGAFASYRYFSPPAVPAPVAPVAGVAEEKALSVPIAVLFFQNLANDEEIDWLSNGLTEMLITDLSQSPGLSVVSTSQLYRALKDLDAPTDKTLPAETLSEFAEKTKVDAIARGSFARLGNAFQIGFTVEDVKTGEIVLSENLNGQGEESVIGLVEQLGARVREHYEAELPPLGPPTLADASSASVEAWRLYIEGLEAWRQSTAKDAIPIYERALAIDPDFALVHASLGQAYGNLGNAGQAKEHMRRAVKLADQLPLNQKFIVEGAYYGSSWSTTLRAIETFNLGLSVYPNNESWRNNLARRYAFVERYSESIEQFRFLIDKGSSFRGNYFGIANSLGALDRFGEGYEILRQFADSQPKAVIMNHYLAWHLTEWGKYEEAVPLIEEAIALDNRPLYHYTLWRVEILQEDWINAEREAESLASTDDSFAKWRGAVSLARNALYKGSSEEALKHFDAAAKSTFGSDRALIRCWIAELYLSRGQVELALEQTRLAQEDGKDEWPELLGFFLEALCHQRAGDSKTADTLVNVLRERWRQQQNAVEERQIHHLEGLLALARGDASLALEHLNRAVALLPPRGVEFHWHVYPDHVPVWMTLGRIELALGRPEVALKWFEKIAESGSEHLERPIEYVRAYHFAGIALEQLGRPDDARVFFDSFRERWPSSDLDPANEGTLP